jgi:hypothetical protein
LIGGLYNQGVLFEYDMLQDSIIKKFDFDGTNGSRPIGGLTEVISANTTASIKNHSSLLNTFSYSPNPCSSETHLYFEKEQKNSTIKITDLLGREIKSISFSGKQLTINTQDLEKAVYLIQAWNGNELIETKQLIIQ